MTDPGSGTDAKQTGSTRAAEYSERLYVTWYWWPLPLLAATILAAEVHSGFGGVRSWLPYVVLIPLTAVLLFRAGRTPVAVRDGELIVGRARVALEHVDTVETFTAREKRAVLGPRLDPAALVVHRGWVGPVLLVRHSNPADPTPYWLFSSRHPEQLAEILCAASSQARSCGPAT